MRLEPPDAAHDVAATISHPGDRDLATGVEWREASGAAFQAIVTVPPGEHDADAIGLFRELSMSAQPASRPSVGDLLAPVRLAVGSQELIRRTLPLGVQSEHVAEDGLRAVLFTPLRQQHVRPVVCLTGSSGGYAVRVAATLAGHGFVTLALAYFGAPGTPDDLVEIPLESLERGIEWLRARVGGDEVAVMGTSKGGELALLLGATFSSISAVVAYVPSSQTQPWATDEGPVASWTHRGEPLPWAPLDISRNPAPNPRLSIRRGYEATLEGAETVERTAIRVEQTRGPIVLISGGRDAMWPSSLFAERVVSRASSHGIGFPVSHLEYPEAGHVIGLPHQPRRPSKFDFFEHGGTPEANARASVDSWPRVVEFLGAP